MFLSFENLIHLQFDNGNEQILACYSFKCYVYVPDELRTLNGSGTVNSTEWLQNWLTGSGTV